MKYCPTCKINAHKSLNNCPLCGSFLEGEPLELKAYEKMEDYVEYPQITLTRKVDFLRSRVNFLLLIAAAVCVVIDLYLNTFKQITWSSYVLVGIFIAIACVIWPIALKSKLYNQVIINLPVLTIASILLELFITRYQSVNISIRWVLPALYACAIVICDFMIIFKSKQSQYIGYFSTLLFSTIFALLLQVLLWSIPSAWAVFYDSYFTLILFIAAIVNLSVLALVCYPMLKAEYDRKLSL